MSEKNTTVAQFDNWIEDESDVAALVMRQWLESVEGKDAVIFPPTYPLEQNWSGYNIDHFADGSNVCQIDSVGSQANRMEPLFKRKEYRRLVPQVLIRTEKEALDILDAGHRSADAIVRFSTPLNSDLFQAFNALRESGDAETLARIAPTSIVFGAWDSRSTQVKLPRIVRSVIRAFDVKEMHRSAQYTTIAGRVLKDGDAETTERGPEAELGLAHVPAVRTHGGVVATGGIRRDSVLNLVPLRALGSASGQVEDTIKLRRYILGLCLVVFTAPQDTFLREGCQLVPAMGVPSEWSLVRHDGERSTVNIEHPATLDFANAAAEEFEVQPGPSYAEFDRDLALKLMSENANNRRALLRRDPATW